VAVNLDKPHLWKADVAQSVDFYNQWFLDFAPKAFRETRIKTTQQVKQALKSTSNLTDIKPDILKADPKVLQMLRMTTCPPIARDRLIGLSGVSSNLVKRMELDNLIPPRMDKNQLDIELNKIGDTIEKMADKDIFTWLDRGNEPDETELYRASTIVADRLCGAISDPIIRNAQEQRQLASLGTWLNDRGYKQIPSGQGIKFDNMDSGTFSFRLIVPITRDDGKTVNIPVDTVIKPLDSQQADFPILIEAKSAGDYTNTNKRRKEEAIKMQQLRNTYGKSVRFILFLCGYFDSGYLGYEAAEGIDWVWEHRIDDLALFDV
jgi:hypothetical protein